LKKTRAYYISWAIALLLTLTGCAGKRFNERISFWRNDRIPYGAWYAYNQLNYIFPDAVIHVNKTAPDELAGNVYAQQEFGYGNGVAKDILTRKTLYLVITDHLNPKKEELEALLDLVRHGHHVFLAAVNIGGGLLDTLHLNTEYRILGIPEDSLTIRVFQPLSHEQKEYSYPGLALDNRFMRIDSSITTVLGTDDLGYANFVKMEYEGGGALYLHLAPIAFTNFFLLHKNNKSYYDDVLSYVPRDIEFVLWDDYYRYYAKGDSGDGSAKGFHALGWIASQPHLNIALWLLVLLLLLIYLFESKRKQRIIPVIKPLKNASLDFVKTVGRLYYQRRDNRNLAQKMTAHFMDHVRSRYNIRTSQIDETFEKRLAWKTGFDPAAIKALLYYIQSVQHRPKVSDEELLELNSRLEEFYEREGWRRD